MGGGSRAKQKDKNKKTMIRNKKIYVPPLIKCVKFTVEQGFAGTNFSNVTYDPSLLVGGADFQEDADFTNGSYF